MHNHHARHRTLIVVATAAITAGVSAYALRSGPEVDQVTVQDVAKLCDIGTCEAATVDRAIDGDTIDIIAAGGQEARVRLLGVDTPETKKPDTPVQCMGPEASQLTETLAPAGTPVTLVEDVSSDEHDQYGRLLRHLIVTDDQGDGTNLGAELLTRGMARTTTFPHSVTSDYAALEAQAKDTGTGLWGQC